MITKIHYIRKYLNKHNKNYKNIKDKIHKIMDRNINIQKLLDEEFHQTYSVEYISSLWRNKIPKVIAE